MMKLLWVDLAFDERPSSKEVSFLLLPPSWSCDKRESDEDPKERCPS